jgi:hypothetical protein
MSESAHEEHAGDDGIREEHAQEIEDFQQKNCRICASPQRGAIEVLALNGDSFAGNARRISDEFDMEISGKSLKNHMLHHASNERARQAGLLLAALGSDEEGAPLLTSKGVVSLLLADALQKVVSGDIRVDSAAQLERVLKLQAQIERDEHQREIDDARLALQTARLNPSGEQRGAEDAFRQLGYIMDAVRETVPKEYLRKSILKAWERGLDRDLVDLSGVPIYQHEPISGPDLNLVVRDIEAIGRTRTYEELRATNWQPIKGVAAGESEDLAADAMNQDHPPDEPAPR